MDATGQRRLGQLERLRLRGVARTARRLLCHPGMRTATALAAPRRIWPTHRTLALVPTSETDAELVHRAVAGTHAGALAEEELYRRYRSAVARLASSFSELDPDEADDVVQEAFVRAFRALASLKDPERFSAWLFTIARNRARSYLSSRATHERAAEEAGREARLSGDTAPAANVHLEREAELRAVREVIDGLREGPEKETVRLFYLEGTLSAREIAQRMGVGKSAVTMRLERFRARIREALVERLGVTA
jgi:RNA polymerase sigma-70 factor (ECF subfamily)